MKKKKRICINCKIPMKKTSVRYKNIDFEAMQCPKCKEKIFTEDLAMKAISKLETERLKSEYIKQPIKIGHSWGITFPKEITDVFDLNKPKTRLKLHPDLEKGKIEISLK
ncbi:hypothetical protein JW851_04980 [Candidatus Woesearchaeota archaeon]|nr:hypothetical protein [Candidatus Woesearchaeota archaeon]